MMKKHGGAASTDESENFIRSDRANSTTGFKGVTPHHDRYMAECNTSSCHHNHLGSFGTPEEAAQVYLQHYQKEHPEEREKERARPVLLPIQERLLIRSDKGQTGFKGVHQNGGSYKAVCTTSPCRRNHLGNFDTPEEAAQAYLQHYQKEHPEELEKKRVPRPGGPTQVVEQTGSLGMDVLIAAALFN